MIEARLVEMLESVRDLLSKEEVGSNQKKSAQSNKASTKAAKAKLAELEKKLSASRTDATKIKATGAARK